MSLQANNSSVENETAILAGGCFWCIEYALDRLFGVVEVRSGYTGGKQPNPSYQEVCSGTTGHYEAVQIKYDPTQISFEQILEVFWMQIDPTDPDGQFADRGPQYRTAIFYQNSDQKQIAIKSKQKLEDSGKFDRPIVTQILPVSEFYLAEDYHQQYHAKNPVEYQAYASNSGRKDFIKHYWYEEDS